MPNFVGDFAIVCWSERDSREPEATYSNSVGVARLLWTESGVERLDTIGTFFWQDGLVVPNPHLPGNTLSLRSPLGARGILKLSGPGPMLAYARNDAYRIELYSVEDASLSMVVERRAPRRARTATELELAIGWPVEYRREVEAHLGRFPVADSLSIARNFLVDDLGYLWVRLDLSGEGIGAPRDVVAPDGSYVGSILALSGHYDVIDPGGRYRGTIELPPDLAIHEVGEDYVLGVRRDQFQVERIELYTLARSEGSQGLR
jgi:hypothetical protein